MQAVTISKRMYQRTLPLVITAVLTVVLIVAFFFFPGYAPLVSLNSEILTSSSIISNFTFFFGYFALIIRYIRPITSSGKTFSGHSSRNEAIIVLASFAGFFILAISMGAALTSGATFSTVYTDLIGMLGTAISSVTFPFFLYNGLRRLRITSLETFCLFITFFLAYLYLGSSLVLEYFPFLGTIGAWIMTCIVTSAERALTLAAAVSAVIVAVRAIGLREPGLIDMEMK